MSLTRRWILLNLVLTAIPQLPNNQSAQIRSAQSQFLWTSTNSLRGWVLVAWKSVMLPTIDGGVGVRDMQVQNQAVVAQLVWRFLIENDSWWTKILRQKYL